LKIVNEPIIKHLIRNIGKYSKKIDMNLVLESGEKELHILYGDLKR